jgi:hypothetical protein
MRVRLTRRLAERLDGVDVSARAVGDVFEVTHQEGELLVAEGWAVQIPAEEDEPIAATPCMPTPSSPRREDSRR